MSEHTDEILVEKMKDYFRKNRTMPGEKKVKDVINAQFTAMQQHKEFIQKEHLPDMPWKWNLHVQEKYQTDRDELTHRMSEIAVKDVKLHGDSRPHPVKKGIRPFDTLIAVRTPDIVEEGVHIHEFWCDISGTGKDQAYKFENNKEDDWEIGKYAGSIPSGFSSNHPGMDGMYGIITVADHSMGKFGNPNIMFSIDLMQESFEMAPELDHLPKQLRLDEDTDFAAAVQNIPTTNTLSL